MLLFFEDCKQTTFHPYGESLLTTATVIIVTNHNWQSGGQNES